MIYTHSRPNLAPFLVRGQEAGVKVPCSQTIRHEAPTRASRCVCAALWGS